MLGKNNFKERLRQMEDQNKKERFSIRKLSIGAASVLIGFAFMGLGIQTVQADVVTPGSKPATEEVKAAANNNSNNANEQKEKPQVTPNAVESTKNEQVNQTAKNDASSLTVNDSAVKAQPETQVKTSNEKKDDASQLVTDKTKDVVTSSKETQTTSTTDTAAKPKIDGNSADKKQAEQKSDAKKTDTEAKANEVAKADETGTVNDVHVTSAADDLEAAMKKTMDLEDLTSGHKLTTDQVSQIDAILEKGQALFNRYYAAQVDGKKITSILRSNPTDGGSTTGNNETEGHESQTFDPSQFANVSHDLNSLLTNLQVNNTYLNNGSFSQTISTDDDFRRAVTDSTTTAIYLTHDISISSSIEDAKNDLTIYGQGHKLTFSNYCSIVTSNASLGFDNVTIDASNRSMCINDTAVADGLSVSFNNVIFKNLTGRFISGIDVDSSSVSFTGANKIESANNSANSPIFRGENLTINGSLVSDSPLPIPLYYGRGLTINGTLKASYNYNNGDPFIYVWNRPLEMNRGITFGSNSQVDIKGNGSSALGLGSDLDSPMPFTIYTGAKVNIDAGDTTPIRFLGNTDVDIDLQGNSELNISGKNGVLQRGRSSSFGKLSISADSGSSLKINTTGNQDSTLAIYAQNPKLISLKTQNGNFDTSKVTFDTNQNAGLYLKSDTEEGSWKVSGIQGSVGNGTIISRAGFWGKTPLAEVPTKGDSSEYKYSSEDEYHEITRGNSFNDLVYSADESQTALQSYSGRYNATSDVVTVHAISGGTEKLGDASSYIHITNSSIQPSASGYNVNNDDTNVIRGIKWIKGVITESSHNAFDPTNPHSNPVTSQAGAITVDANGDVTLNASVGTVGINGSNATIAVTYHDGSIDYVPVKLNVVSAEVKHGNTDPSQPNSQNNPIYLNIKTPDDSDAENVISNTDQLSQWHPTYEFTDDQGNPISEFGSGTDISGDNSHKLIQTNVKVSYKNATDPNVADGYQIIPVFIRVNKTLADQYSDDVKAKNNFKVLDGSQTSLQNDAKAALDITIPASDPQPTVTWAVNPTVQTDGSYKGTVNVVFTDPTDNSTSSFTRDITYHVIAKAVSKTDQNAITFNEDGTNVATPSITIKNGENEGQDLLNWNGRSEPEGQSYSVSGLIYIHDHPDLLEPTEVQHQNANVQVQLADNNTYTGGQNDVTLANGHKVYNVSVALIIPSDAANHHPGTVDSGRHPVNPEDPDGQQFYVDGDNVYVHVNGTVPAVDQVVKVTDGQGQAVASGADTYTISGWNVPSTATAGDHAEQLTINYHDGTRATLDLNVHVIGGNGADLTHTVYGGTTSPAAKNQISNNSDLASKFGDNISYSWYKDADGTTAMTNADFNTVTTAGNSDNAWIKINWGDGTSEMVGIKLNLTSDAANHHPGTVDPGRHPVNPEDPDGQQFYVDGDNVYVHVNGTVPAVDQVVKVTDGQGQAVASGADTYTISGWNVPSTATAGDHAEQLTINYHDGTRATLDLNVHVIGGNGADLTHTVYGGTTSPAAKNQISNNSDLASKFGDNISYSWYKDADGTTAMTNADFNTVTTAGNSDNAWIKINWGDGTSEMVGIKLNLTSDAANHHPGTVDPGRHPVNPEDPDGQQFYVDGDNVYVHVNGTVPAVDQVVKVTDGQGQAVASGADTYTISGWNVPSTATAGDHAEQLTINYHDGTRATLDLNVHVIGGNGADLTHTVYGGTTSPAAKNQISNNSDLASKFGDNISYSWYKDADGTTAMTNADFNTVTTAGNSDNAWIKINWGDGTSEMVGIKLNLTSDAANHHPGTVDPGRHPVNPEDPDGQQFYVDGDNVYVHVNGTVPAVDQVVKVTDGQGQAVASGADTYTISGWNVPSTATAGDHAEQLTINYHDGTRATLDLNVHVIGGNGADLTHTVYGGTTSPAAKNQISNNSDLASKFGDNISYSWYKDADGTTAMTNADFNTVTTAGNSDNAWIKINWGDGTSEMVGIKLNLTSDAANHHPGTVDPGRHPVNPEDPDGQQFYVDGDNVYVHVNGTVPAVDQVVKVTDGQGQAVASGADTYTISGWNVPSTATAGDHAEQLTINYHDGTRATLDLNVHVIGGNGADLTHTVYGGTTSPAAKNQISNNSDLASKFGDNISYSWYKDADGTTAMTNADFNTVTTAGNSDNAWIKINWGDGTSEMVGIKLNLTSDAANHHPGTVDPGRHPVNPEDPDGQQFYVDGDNVYVHVNGTVPAVDQVVKVTDGQGQAVASGADTYTISGWNVPSTATAGDHAEQLTINYHDGTRATLDLNVHVIGGNGADLTHTVYGGTTSPAAKNQISNNSDLASKFGDNISYSWYKDADGTTAMTNADFNTVTTAGNSDNAWIKINWGDGTSEMVGIKLNLTSAHVPDNENNTPLPRPIPVTPGEDPSHITDSTPSDPVPGVDPDSVPSGSHTRIDPTGPVPDTTTPGSHPVDIIVDYPDGTHSNPIRTTIVVPESEEPVYVPEEPTQPAPTTPATITTSVIFTDHGHEIAGFPISGKEGETIPLAKVKEIIKNNMPKGYVLDMDLEKAWKEGKFIISAKHPIYINIVKTHRQMVLFIDKKGRIVKRVYVVVKEGQKFSKKFVGRLSRKHQPKGYKMTSYRKVAKHLDIFVSGKKTKATDYGKLVLYVGKGGKIIKRANINKTKNKFDKANAKKHLPNGYKQAGHKHINRHVDVWVNKK